MITLTLSDPWFEYVRQGRKIYEGRRLKMSFFRTLSVGTLIKFKHYNNEGIEPFYARVIGILEFNSFQEALEQLPLSEVLPDVATIAEGVSIYEQYVSQRAQKQSGVCMLKIALARKEILRVLSPMLRELLWAINDYWDTIKIEHQAEALALYRRVAANSSLTVQILAPGDARFVVRFLENLGEITNIDSLMLLGSLRSACSIIVEVTDCPRV